MPLVTRTMICFQLLYEMILRKKCKSFTSLVQLTVVLSCSHLQLSQSKSLLGHTLFDYAFSSVQVSRSVMANSLQPHESQHARPPCPKFTQIYIQWVSDAIQPSQPLSSPSPSAPNPSQHQSLFQWVNSSHGASAPASFFPKKSQGWSPSEWTGWISLQSNGLSRVFSNTAVQKHQFFGTQPSSQSNSLIHT